MTVPAVVNVMDDAVILSILEELGLYKIFMEQIQRYPMERDSIVRLKAWEGTDLYYFSYHNDPTDRGYLLTLVTNATPQIEEIIDETNRRASRKRDVILYVDSPELRN